MISLCVGVIAAVMSQTTSERVYIIPASFVELYSISAVSGAAPSRGLALYNTTRGHICAVKAPKGFSDVDKVAMFPVDCNIGAGLFLLQGVYLSRRFFWIIDTSGCIVSEYISNAYDAQSTPCRSLYAGFCGGGSSIFYSDTIATPEYLSNPEQDPLSSVFYYDFAKKQRSKLFDRAAEVVYDRSNSVLYARSSLQGDVAQSEVQCIMYSIELMKVIPQDQQAELCSNTFSSSGLYYLDGSNQLHGNIGIDAKSSWEAMLNKIDYAFMYWYRNKDVLGVVLVDKRGGGRKQCEVIFDPADGKMYWVNGAVLDGSVLSNSSSHLLVLQNDHDIVEIPVQACEHVTIYDIHSRTSATRHDNMKSNMK